MFSKVTLQHILCGKLFLNTANAIHKCTPNLTSVDTVLVQVFKFSITKKQCSAPNSLESSEKNKKKMSSNCKKSVANERKTHVTLLNCSFGR